MVVSYIQSLKKVDCVELKNGKIMEAELRKMYGITFESCETVYQRVRKVLVEYSQKKMIVF